MSAIDSLGTRSVQLAAVVLTLLIGGIAAPLDRSDVQRFAVGVAVLSVSLAAAGLVLLWRREARRFIPILALILSAPIVSFGLNDSEAPGPEYPFDMSGSWQAQDPYRSYVFQISQAPNGDLSGSVVYGSPGQRTERYTLSGSRMNAGVLIRLHQTSHAPWKFHGEFVSRSEIRAYVSAGDMITFPITISRRVRAP
jgi:hypothetical protein